jgi:hypothetical protein
MRLGYGNVGDPALGGDVGEFGPRSGPIAQQAQKRGLVRVLRRVRLHPPSMMGACSGRSSPNIPRFALARKTLSPFVQVLFLVVMKVGVVRVKIWTTCR